MDAHGAPMVACRMKNAAVEGGHDGLHLLERPDGRVGCRQVREVDVVASVIEIDERSRLWPARERVKFCESGQTGHKVY